MSLLSPVDVQHGMVHVPERSRPQQLLLSGCAAVLASVFVAMCAHVAVPLPFTPVPFTLQPFAVLLTGMLLGPAGGFAALAVYLCEGAAGLPVFTPMGLPGVARLWGPTGGYLMAYPFAAALAGGLPRAFRRIRPFFSYAAGGTVAMLTIYAAGAIWFSRSLGLALMPALAGAVVPFAASDAVKICAAAGIASALRVYGTNR